MRDLTRMVEQYLQIKRAQGAKLVDVGRNLGLFCDYVRDTGSTELSVRVAVGFATDKEDLSDRSIALRLSAVRGFCRWAQALEPGIEVPPNGLLKARGTRYVPYIYTTEEVSELMEIASSLHPKLRATTFAAFMGLMAATGIRTGEACALDLGDFKPVTGMLKITGKYGKVRVLPLDFTVVEALSAYAEIRMAYLPAASCPALMVSSRGTRLNSGTVDTACRQVVARSSLLRRSCTCRPRLTDLRHTFAVNTMLHAYETGQDPRLVLPVLSTWMGHSLIAHTYWYLGCTPELMQAAAQRLEKEES